MLRLLQCEAMKLRRSRFLLIGIAGTLIVPFFIIIKAVTRYGSDSRTVVSLFTLYDDALMFLMLLFAPLVLTILHAWIVSREYTDGTLKNVFVIPVSKTAFLCGKLLFLACVTFAFMLISWLEILVLALLCSLFLPVSELTFLSALFFLVRMLSGGLLLCATQTPFLYLTIRTKGFVAPLIAAAAVCFINVVLSGSPVAGVYPWSASWLFACRRFHGQSCPAGLSAALILMTCFWGIAASLLRFRREEVG